MKKADNRKKNNLKTLTEEGMKFYSVINTHQNFDENSFYADFLKEVPIKTELVNQIAHASSIN